MNRLETLRYFCAAAQTLQFRKAASRLSVSPQVVTRVMAELEAALGEPLFVRSTRQVRLTDFGTRFLPRARQFLLDGEKLFAMARQKDDEMAGVVRITVPRLPGNEALLADLLARCADYPDWVIDWRVDEARLNAVENCIDMGVRLGLEPQPLMIVRRIAQTRDLFVAAPLQEGRLVELFPSLRRASWSLFLYRPQRRMTPARNLPVFDWLTQALRRQYAGRQ